MAIEERGKSVPQFGSHPVEQKIAQHITTEMKTTEMRLCLLCTAGRIDGGCGSADDIAAARRV